MVVKVLRMLEALQWAAALVGVWALVTGRWTLWMGPTLFALVWLSRGLDAWINRVLRSDFKKPRSSYPNGDNGYNDRDGASRSDRKSLEPAEAPGPPRHRGGRNLSGG